MSNCGFNKVASNFIEITFQHGCSPLNLLHISRIAFLKNTSGGLLLPRLLYVACCKFSKERYFPNS